VNPDVVDVKNSLKNPKRKKINNLPKTKKILNIKM